MGFLTDVFLRNLIKQEEPATIIVHNGYHMEGTIRDFDDYGIIVHVDGTDQLVMLNSISTIIPLGQEGGSQ